MKQFSKNSITKIRAICLPLNNIEYKILSRNILHGFLYIILIVGALATSKYFFSTTNFETSIHLAVLPPIVFGVFFISESFLGILPQDFFILWSLQCSHPVIFLFLLAFLSYFGGIVSLLLGKKLCQIKYLAKYLNGFSNKYKKNILSWGGMYIAIAAFTPIPFSIISILSGSMDYPLNRYMAFASVRILRFLMFGWLFWEIQLF